MTRGKSKAIDAEVLPPEAKRTQGKSDTVSDSVTPVRFAEAADLINSDFARYGELEREATILALRIGMALEMVKDELPHGQLEKWIKANCVIGVRHARRFRQLAKVFLGSCSLPAHKGYLLCEPEARGHKKVEQLAFAFLGDKSQAELFAEHGIQVRERKQLGGEYHQPKPTEIPEGETLEHMLAAEGWADLLKQIFHRVTVTKDFGLLRSAELRDAHFALRDAAAELKECMDRG